MRELKFRAWFPERIECYPIELDGKRSPANMHYFGLFDHAGELRDDAIIMQYTGLKDKNGKEIYEGDIVNLIPDGYVSELAKVEWDGSHAQWIYRRISSLEIANGTGVYIQWKPVEVIGNIYENSELLEEV